MRAFLPLALVVGSSVAVVPGVRAAQITDVPDAADGDNPIDVNLELKFDFMRHTALITRENTQPPPDDPDGEPRTADVKELEWERQRFRLKPRLEVGVYHDLGFFVEWPIVLWDQQTTRFAEDTDASNSTLIRDRAPNPTPTVEGWPEVGGAGNDEAKIQGDNNDRYGFPNNGYNNWRFDGEGNWAGYRQGLDNPTFGVRWSPLNNERDETKPTVTLQTDYTPPFFAFMNPTLDELEDTGAPGGVADGLHKFHFSIAMSKRFLVLDPYFMVDYTIPFTGGKDEHLLGQFPRQSGGFVAGVEIVPYEDKKLSQRFVIELQGSARYFSEGRDYSEVSDLFREQTYTDQFVRVGAEAGIGFKAFKLFFFDLQGMLNYDTEHFLNIEDFGKDLADDDNDEIDLDDPNERNPFYNPAIDTVGRRLRIEQSLQLGVQAHIGVTF
ncbi:MAG: hypothetical protein Q8O67_24810 [Deltaproteobacteria bacterium]|nr:hypothetical protein [Deltaproteobacteria bacterium]